MSDLESRGETIAREDGCNACHSVDGSDSIGPTWEALAGSEVELEDGTPVVADSEYLRRSIIDPNAQIRAGYRAIMPERRLEDAEVDALVAYIEWLGAGAGADRDGAGGES